MAVSGNHSEVVQLLLDAGAVVEAVFETRLPRSEKVDGMTDLMDASLRGFADITRRLLRAGAHVEARSSVSLFPGALTRASCRTFRFPARSRVRCCPRVQAYGLTPLMLSSHFGHADVVRLLLRAGASTQTRPFKVR